MKSETPPAAAASPYDERTYKALLAAAEYRLPCPSNAELGRALGITQQSAGYALQRVERAGLISIHRRPSGRAVTIIATGQTITSARYDASVQRSAEWKPEAPVVIPRRDPCPRCNVRPEFGCAHGWNGEYFARVAA